MSETTPPLPPAKWDPIIAFKTCMKRYTQFSGRASRSEYWFFALSCFIIGLICGCIDVFIFLGLPICQLVFSLGIIIPSLAVSWRRMHDSGLSGAHSLWGLIPYLGAIPVIILACRASDNGPNQFGDAPAGPEQ
ncbi:MAG: DUF805 domain-containing protein [Akkermansia sp.]|nr:DUF805 domain-containing protein [Akkermansia sp.]